MPLPGWLRRPRLENLEAQAQPYRQLAQPPSCRVCWSEAEQVPGGTLLAPCACRGSSQFIHEHCLSRWLEVALEQHGPDEYLRCRTCLQAYALPPSLRPPAPGLGPRADRLRQLLCRALTAPFSFWERVDNPEEAGILFLVQFAMFVNAAVSGTRGALGEANEATLALDLSHRRPREGSVPVLRRLGALAALHSLFTSDGLG